MVRSNYFIKFNSLLLAFFCLPILTGCPGPGDRFRFDETAQVSKKGDNVCVNIDNAQDYQPVDMGINLRGTPSKEKVLFPFPRPPQKNLLIFLPALRLLKVNYVFHHLIFILKMVASI